MSNPKKFGDKGEDAATEYLVQKSYTILERGFRYRKMEIDIIASYKDLIIRIILLTE